MIANRDRTMADMRRSNPLVLLFFTEHGVFGIIRSHSPYLVYFS